MRRRFKVEEVLLVAIFMVTAVVAVFLGSYINDRAKFTRAKEGLFGQNAQSFYTQYNETNYTEAERLMPRLREIVDRHGTVLLHSLFGGASYDSFYGYYCKDPSFLIPMASGRAFTAEDMAGNEKVCMAGIELSGQFNFRREGDGWVLDLSENIKGNKGDFAVIGRMGYQTNQRTKLNYTVLLAMNGSWELNNPDSSLPWILDGRRPADIARCLKEIEALFSEHGITLVPTELPITQYNVADFFNMDLLNLLMYIFGAFTVVLSTVPLSVLWMKRRRKSIAVRRMLGFGLGQICGLVFLRFFLLFNLGFAAGLGIFGLAALIGHSLLEVTAESLLIAYAISLVFNICVSAVPIAKTMRIEPGDALRRD